MSRNPNQEYYDHGGDYYDGQYHHGATVNSYHNADQYYSQPYDDYGELYNGFVPAIFIHKKHNLMNLAGLVRSQPIHILTITFLKATGMARTMSTMIGATMRLLRRIISGTVVLKTTILKARVEQIKMQRHSVISPTTNTMVTVKMRRVELVTTTMHPLKSHTAQRATLDGRLPPMKDHMILFLICRGSYTQLGPQTLTFHSRRRRLKISS